MDDVGLGSSSERVQIAPLLSSLSRSYIVGWLEAFLCTLILLLVAATAPCNSALLQILVVVSLCMIIAPLSLSLSILFDKATMNLCLALLKI